MIPDFVWVVQNSSDIIVYTLHKSKLPLLTTRLPLLIVYKPLITPFEPLRKVFTKDWQQIAKDRQHTFHIPRTARAQLAVKKPCKITGNESLLNINFLYSTDFLRWWLCVLYQTRRHPCCLCSNWKRSFWRYSP